MISDNSYGTDENGNIVPLADPSARLIFCGEGATLDGDRAAQLERFLAAQVATQKAADDQIATQKAADAKKLADDLAAEQAAAKKVADDKKTAEANKDSSKDSSSE